MFLSEQEQIEQLKIFNNEFHQTIDSWNDEGYGVLNYKKAVNILITLGFMHKPNEKENYDYNQERQLLFDIWRILRGNEHDGVSVRNFKLILWAIMKFNFCWMKNLSDNNEICLTMNNDKQPNVSLKNSIIQKNNQTIENLSSIRHNFTSSMNDSFSHNKLKSKIGNLFTNLNPSLQRFLANKDTQKWNTIDENSSSWKSVNMDQKDSKSKKITGYSKLPTSRLLVPKCQNINNGGSFNYTYKPISPKMSKSKSSSQLNNLGAFTENGDFVFIDDSEIISKWSF